MRYAVTLKASADKSLEKLPHSVRRRVVAKAELLGDDPRPASSKKLAGGINLWRIRVGDWRVVYAVDDDAKVVDVRIIAHRREVYRDL
jgi:mRNA interferase RelE/StbE